MCDENDENFDWYEYMHYLKKEREKLEEEGYLDDVCVKGSECGYCDRCLL